MTEQTCSCGRAVPGPWTPARRDRYAVAVANWILRTFASEGYNRQVRSLIAYGFEKRFEMRQANGPRVEEKR